jgi:hypothetical protein
MSDAEGFLCATLPASLTWPARPASVRLARPVPSGTTPRSRASAASGSVRPCQLPACPAWACALPERPDGAWVRLFWCERQALSRHSAPPASPSSPDPPPAIRPTTSLPQRRAPDDVVATTTSLPPPQLPPPAGAPVSRRADPGDPVSRQPARWRTLCLPAPRSGRCAGWLAVRGRREDSWQRIDGVSRLLPYSDLLTLTSSSRRGEGGSDRGS